LMTQSLHLGAEGHHEKATHHIRSEARHQSIQKWGILALANYFRGWSADLRGISQG